VDGGPGRPAGGYVATPPLWSIPREDAIGGGTRSIHEAYAPAAAINGSRRPVSDVVNILYTKIGMKVRNKTGRRSLQKQKQPRFKAAINFSEILKY
jgi:hypothetical protein